MPKRLPRQISNALKEWLYKNSTCPYPSETQKSRFMKELKLTRVQLDNWFINARRRYLALPVRPPNRKNGRFNSRSYLSKRVQKQARNLQTLADLVIAEEAKNKLFETVDTESKTLTSELPSIGTPKQDDDEPIRDIDDSDDKEEVGGHSDSNTSSNAFSSGTESSEESPILNNRHHYQIAQIITAIPYIGSKRAMSIHHFDPEDEDDDDVLLD